MRDVLLEQSAKKVLVKEYGEKAVIIDEELNSLAKLIIKRKDCIIAFNRGNYSSKDKYIEITSKIKNLIAEINEKLALKNC